MNHMPDNGDVQSFFIIWFFYINNLQD